MTNKKKTVEQDAKDNETEESREFRERKELIKLQVEADENKYNRILEIEKFKRETNRRAHEQELERGRIKTAEIRKTQIMREQGRRY